MPCYLSAGLRVEGRNCASVLFLQLHEEGILPVWMCRASVAHHGLQLRAALTVSFIILRLEVFLWLGSALVRRLVRGGQLRVDEQLRIQTLAPQLADLMY